MPFCDSRSTRTTSAEREQRPRAWSPAPRPPRWSPRSSGAARRASTASSFSRSSSAARNDLGLVADHAVGVVVRALPAAGPRARASSASTPSPVRRRDRHERVEVAELAGRDREAARRSSCGLARVDLVHDEDRRRVAPARRARRRTGRRGRSVGSASTRKHIDVDLAERRRARARWCARRAACAACGCRACRGTRSASGAVVRTPRICVRVVCGRSETIETLRPTSRFTSVDFPTFGRPTIETNPERNPCGAGGTVAPTTRPLRSGP